MCGWVALADVFEDTDWVCVGGWVALTDVFEDADWVCVDGWH